MAEYRAGDKCHNTIGFSFNMQRDVLKITPDIRYFMYRQLLSEQRQNDDFIHDTCHMYTGE